VRELEPQTNIRYRPLIFGAMEITLAFRIRPLGMQHLQGGSS
jgi:hypothetical protein